MDLCDAILVDRLGREFRIENSEAGRSLGLLCQLGDGLRLNLPNWASVPIRNSRDKRDAAPWR